MFWFENFTKIGKEYKELMARRRHWQARRQCLHHFRAVNLPSLDTTGLSASLLNFLGGLACRGSSSELVGDCKSTRVQCFHSRKSVCDDDLKVRPTECIFEGGTMFEKQKLLDLYFYLRVHSLSFVRVTCI